MSARYEVIVYQSNNRSNQVPVTVTADNATQAKRKAVALASHIHSPIVKITSVSELPAPSPVPHQETP